MYPVSSEIAALFDANQRQVLRITGTDANGVELTITDANVMMNGFSIDRYCCNGERIEIGTAIASELRLKLNNSTGTYTGIVFEGAELFVEIGIADWTQEDPIITYIPCGYFTPDEQPRTRTIITLSALDRMMRFDTVTPTLTPWTNESGTVMTTETGEIIYFCAELVTPCTLADLIDQVCVICDVELGTDISAFPNATTMIDQIPITQEDITYRSLIQWAAGMMGTNAFIDWEGKLRFQWFTDTGYNSTTSRRYSSDLYENDIFVTGVKFTDSDNNTYLAGTETYALDLSGNPLVAVNPSLMLQPIYARVHGFKYRPFTATVKPAPWLFPMDRVTFTDAEGNGHVSLLTNVNTTINGHTSIAAKGETSKVNSYASPSAMTEQQRQVLDRVQRVTSTALATAVANATAQITGTNDSHVRFMYDENGGLQEILIMDTDDVSTATKVWRWNSGGLGFSGNGYAGPYTTAITQDGSIVADFITTGILNANVIKAGTLMSSKNPNNYWNLDTGEMSIQVGNVQNAVSVSTLNTTVNNLTISPRNYAIGTSDEYQYLSNSSRTVYYDVSPDFTIEYYNQQAIIIVQASNISGRTDTTPQISFSLYGTDGSGQAWTMHTGPLTPPTGTSSSNLCLWRLYLPEKSVTINRIAINLYRNVLSSGNEVEFNQFRFAKGWSRVEWVPAIEDQEEQTVDKAQTAVDTALTQEAIFNKLTNDGQAQGLILDANGNLYVNATYINTGTMSANLVRSGVLSNISGTMAFNLDTGEINSTYSTRYLKIGEANISGGITSFGEGSIGFDNFIDGGEIGPYLTGKNITFDADAIQVTDTYTGSATLYNTINNLDVLIPTAINSQGVVTNWQNAKIVHGLLCYR